MQKTRRTLPPRRRTKAVWFALIVALATAAAMFAAWRVPNLNLYAQDQMMRTRGDLPEPEDILVVAIDEASIAKLGQFPWKRSLTAQVLDKISPAQPRAIALDILYSEPTDSIEDKSLTDSIKKAGNVVISEQLIENHDTPELGHSEWLKSLPDIENSAAGAGHVNVETERDGAARELLLRLADDEGNSRWALAIETVRVGDYLNADEISETSHFVRVGTRRILFTASEKNLFIKKKDANSRLTSVQPLRMTIDYIGATGAFAAQTVSFSDVLDGKIAPERFRGKYVLIGATAATLGDRISTPFVHTENAEGNQHGDLMPGVEILANEINTILRERFYRNVSDWTVAFLTVLVAFAVIFLTAIAEGKFEAAKQLVGLFALFALIILASYFAFTRAFLVLPVVPMLASFAAATPLALLRRSLSASADLDLRIGELIAAEKSLLNGERDNLENLSSETDAEKSLNNIFLPHGLEWKTETLGYLSRDLIARSMFIDRALRSLDEGLIIAETNGRITFANERAAQVLGVSTRKLIGSDLFARLSEAGQGAEISKSLAEETLTELLDEHQTVEREIVIGGNAPRYYILRLSAVVANENGFSETLGIVAALSDVSQHRELEKTKNDVIALVTHELRTPLTAIQGLSELLTEHEIEPASQSKMLTTINSEAKRLARMVNEYLDITRLESGAQKARFAPVNVDNLVEQTLLLLEPLAAKRGIKFVRRFENIQTNINADAELLARAMTNIVANAIKYSPDKTSITIETRSSDKFLEISVRDEGFGISAEQLPRIFEKFYRVPPRKQSSEVAGTGLGLALTQEIIELHGGRISVESELNKGSKFTILLPFSPLN
jgi:signal transduction histidine kinase/CHASE2 domain-containing sensor protein